MKLNLCSFTVMARGWLNIDRLPLAEYATANGYEFKQWDIAHGILFPAGSVDAIVWSHGPEHFTPPLVTSILRDCCRLLRPGGVLRMAVPDMALLARQYVAGELAIHDAHNTDAAVMPQQGNKFWHLLVGGEHRSGWDAETLQAACRAAGFASATQTLAGQSCDAAIRAETRDMYPELSLYVDAVKSR